MMRRAFTIIELLVSMALMAFLLTTATYAFTQVKKMTARIQARQALHNTARIVYERLRFEIDALHQGGAFYVRSGGSAGPVELIFYRGKLDTVDFAIDNRYGFDTIINTDHVWTRWAWIPDRKTVTVASSTPRRHFQLLSDWAPKGVNYKNQWFGHMPQPRRVAGADPTALDASAFGTPSSEDYGDYTDLLNSSGVVALNCTDLRIEVMLQDGSTITGSTSVSSNHAIDGILVDGSASGDKRPRLIRMRFDLADERYNLIESFSFSFLAPGLLPL